MGIGRSLVKVSNKLLGRFDLELRRRYPDFFLHQYESYEAYRATQVFHNKRKLGSVWADAPTLDLLIDRVKVEFGAERRLFALCHGSRNGFEQNYIAEKLAVDILGTDISETATQFPRSVQWDFHDRNEEWLSRCDFVYTNSLDQSWKPREAVAAWLDQLCLGGLLFIEHTDKHGPSGAGEMDPFGAEPYYMPYLLCDWFGHAIAVEVIKASKSNMKEKVWLFVVKKLQTPAVPA